MAAAISQAYQFGFKALSGLAIKVSTTGVLKRPDGVPNRITELRHHFQ